MNVPRPGAGQPQPRAFTFVNAPPFSVPTRVLELNPSVALLRARIPPQVFGEMTQLIAFLPASFVELKRAIEIRIEHVRRELELFVTSNAFSAVLGVSPETPGTPRSPAHHNPPQNIGCSNECLALRKEVERLHAKLALSASKKSIRNSSDPFVFFHRPTQEANGFSETPRWKDAVSSFSVDPNNYLLKLQRADSQGFEILAPTPKPLKSKLDQSSPFRSRLMASADFVSMLRDLPFEELAARSGISQPRLSLGASNPFKESDPPELNPYSELGKSLTTPEHLDSYQKCLRKPECSTFVDGGFDTMMPKLSNQLFSCVPEIEKHLRDEPNFNELEPKVILSDISQPGSFEFSPGILNGLKSAEEVCEEIQKNRS